MLVEKMEKKAEGRRIKRACNRKDPKEKGICEYCGSSFWGYKTKRRKYCSLECYRKNLVGKAAKGKRKPMFGKESPSWKGGVTHKDGYRFIMNREHPYSGSHGYVREHRLVMEKHIGRYLNPTEIVHHENKIKDDNRIENLKLFKTRGDHVRYHSKNKQ